MKEDKSPKMEKHIKFFMISAVSFLVSVLITTFYLHFTEAGIVAWNLFRYKG